MYLVYVNDKLKTKTNSKYHALMACRCYIKFYGWKSYILETITNTIIEYDPSMEIVQLIHIVGSTDYKLNRIIETEFNDRVDAIAYYNRVKELYKSELSNSFGSIYIIEKEVVSFDSASYFD